MGDGRSMRRTAFLAAGFFDDDAARFFDFFGGIPTDSTGVKRSGGCGAVLQRAVVGAGLRRCGQDVLRPRMVPPGDIMLYFRA